MWRRLKEEPWEVSKGTNAVRGVRSQRLQGAGVWAGERRRPGLSNPQEPDPTTSKLGTGWAENITVIKGTTIMEVLTEDVGSPDVH